MALPARFPDWGSILQTCSVSLALPSAFAPSQRFSKTQAQLWSCPWLAWLFSHYFISIRSWWFPTTWRWSMLLVTLSIQSANGTHWLTCWWNWMHSFPVWKLSTSYLQALLWELNGTLIWFHMTQMWTWRFSRTSYIFSNKPRSFLLRQSVLHCRSGAMIRMKVICGTNPSPFAWLTSRQVSMPMDSWWTVPKPLEWRLPRAWRSKTATLAPSLPKGKNAGWTFPPPPFSPCVAARPGWISPSHVSPSLNNCCSICMGRTGASPKSDKTPETLGCWKHGLDESGKAKRWQMQPTRGRRCRCPWRLTIYSFRGCKNSNSGHAGALSALQLWCVSWSSCNRCNIAREFLWETERFRFFLIFGTWGSPGKPRSLTGTTNGQPTGLFAELPRRWLPETKGKKRRCCSCCCCSSSLVRVSALSDFSLNVDSNVFSSATSQNASMDSMYLFSDRINRRMNFFAWSRESGSKGHQWYRWVTDASGLCAPRGSAERHPRAAEALEQKRQLQGQRKVTDQTWSDHYGGKMWLAWLSQFQLVLNIDFHRTVNFVLKRVTFTRRPSRKVTQWDRPWKNSGATAGCVRLKWPHWGKASAAKAASSSQESRGHRSPTKFHNLHESPWISMNLHESGSFSWDSAENSCVFDHWHRPNSRPKTSAVQRDGKRSFKRGTRTLIKWDHWPCLLTKFHKTNRSSNYGHLWIVKDKLNIIL